MLSAPPINPLGTLVEDDVFPVPASTGEVVAQASPEEPVEFRPLTTFEDTFVLAVIEYGGNLGKAYRSVWGDKVNNAAAKARMLMQKPEIIARITELTNAVFEGALMSLGSHLVELADIRDLAKVQGNLKVALNAEQSRGQVAGFYKEKGGAGVGNNAPVIFNIQSGSVDVHI